MGWGVQLMVSAPKIKYLPASPNHLEALRKRTFVAIDFETSHSHRASMCQVGLARVADGEVVGTRSLRVRPNSPYDLVGQWQYENMQLRGEQLQDAPGFDQVGPWLQHNVGADVWIGWNIRGADLSIFNQTWRSWPHLGTPPNICFVDILGVAKKLHPKTDSIPNYCLDVIYYHVFGRPMGGEHHDARDDALATAELAIAFAAQVGLDGYAQVRPGSTEPLVPPTIRRLDQYIPPRAGTQ